MALSPGIPTSFVPKQPVQPVGKRPMSTGNNIFLIVSLVIMSVTIIAAISTFAYDRYLTHVLATKSAALSDAQSKVDENTIEDFVRLRDRLTTGKELLTNHVALSQFFDTLESLTLTNVRYSDMKLIIAADNTATINLTGTAKSFNTLAAQSSAFAGEKKIKRAIFSAISLNSDKLVTFTLTADLDPKLILQNTTSLPASGPASAAVPTNVDNSLPTTLSASSSAASARTGTSSAPSPTR